MSEDALIDLHRRLSTLPARSSDRRLIIGQVAQLYGISQATLYRILRGWIKPKALRRSDCGIPRIMPKPELERYCEIIAAVKLRTSNKKGRHLSTVGVIRLLEEVGVVTPDGLVKAPQAELKPTTINRYLRSWGFDRETLSRQPAAVRFQARHSNECWQFDLSPSDLKEVKEPLWVQPGRGTPLLMLYSVVDDRSGVAYQEYHCVYGEDVESALRFLFNAMAPKKIDGFPFQGIPQMIYTDNGPIARSHVFHQVMKYLGVEVRTHVPQGKDGRRVTARSKGKVERPFRSVKEMHETLYHFHEPKDEEEANDWLMRFLFRYNAMDHRSEPHSRMEDWFQNLPSNGFREMCTWERFCTFAREPERRKVGSDARVRAEGVFYEVDSELAGEEVILWWGFFDHELYVEHGEKRYGPYSPVGGPIPLHRYRQHKKSKIQQRADRIEVLAKNIFIPKTALTGDDKFQCFTDANAPIIKEPFSTPDPFQELVFRNSIAAKKAIADYLGMPLAKLERGQMEQIELILSESMEKEVVIQKIRELFKGLKQR
ncbi:MAG: transposase family protein [Deltaproteobacteria bacterium]|nr:transposase family protein [Deltaproteobacteria bacterium]